MRTSSCITPIFLLFPAISIGVDGIPVLVVNHGMKSSLVTFGYILEITMIPKLL